MSILLTLLVLGLLICIHEWGHFIACRMTKVKVEKFSIGFGPKVFSWKGQETEYVLAAIPFGGFVKPQGENLEELGEDYKPKKGDYLNASLFSRILIVVAGAAMNFVLAWFLFTAIFMVGKPTLTPVIGEFVEGYPAQVSELKVGDEILSVNGNAISNWTELTNEIINNETNQILLNVSRDDREKQVLIKAKVEEGQDVFGETRTLNRIGIQPSGEYVTERFGFVDSIKNGSMLFLNTTAMTYKALWRLVTGRLSLKNLAGPIGIISITGKAAELGLVYLLQLTALISATLGIFNLLPFPALDGGHLMFLVIEGIRRKPVSLNVQGRATQIGFLLLMVLMVVVMYNDLNNLQVFDKIKQVFTG